MMQDAGYRNCVFHLIVPCGSCIVYPVFYDLSDSLHCRRVSVIKFGIERVEMKVKIFPGSTGWTKHLL